MLTRKVVDRLLASPPLRRTHGDARGSTPRVTPTAAVINSITSASCGGWRDYVIKRVQPQHAFQTSSPIEQIAGDMLPNATLDQKIATAFNRNHRTNSEGGIIPEEFAAEYVVDRVATTSSVFLGRDDGLRRAATITKYDPFYAKKEFYQLFSYFNNVPELGKSRKGNTNPYIKAPTPEQQGASDGDGRQKSKTAAQNVFSSFVRLSIRRKKSWLKSLAGKASRAIRTYPRAWLVTFR